MKFSITDQLKFSEISQDFNPIHCDEILSRRYIFGEPIVHGTNAMIFAIKEWSKLSDSPFFIDKLKCIFRKPIFLNKKITTRIENINDSIKITLIQEHEIKIKILMDVSASKHNYFEMNNNDSYTNKSPTEFSLDDLKNYSGKVDCSLNVSLAEKYYSKEFVHKIGCNILAEILSYSRIIGMHAPGLNSIFSQLMLHKNIHHSNLISYEVNSIDKRFNIINIKSDGPNFSACLKAFYRPPKVKQKTIEEIKNYILVNEFKDHRALIIGASRGLGEITAKCLGCGGASLQLTYAKGMQDIIDVSNAILGINNQNVSFLKLDITKSNEIDFNAIKHFKPTHVFYYATPFIFSGSKNKFSKEKYNKFRLYYLDAFEILVKNLSELNKNIKILYPSSIAIDEEPADMLEYTLAKKEGEELCLKLEKKYLNLKIICPRLPRLYTDQTVSLTSVKNEDPIQILDIIRSMSNRD